MHARGDEFQDPGPRRCPVRGVVTVFATAAVPPTPGLSLNLTRLDVSRCHVSSDASNSELQLFIRPHRTAHPTTLLYTRKNVLIPDSNFHV